MNIQKKVLQIDYAILFCLSLLIFVLPIAHTATIRSFALFTPAALLIFRYYFTKDFRWIKTSFELPFMAFLIAAAASLMTSVDFRESLKEISGELLTPILLFYISYLAVKKDSDGILLTRVLFIGSLVFSIASFYALYMKGGSLFEATYRAGGLRDPGGGEIAGLYHTMVIPFLFWGMFYFRKASQRIALYALFAINLAGLHVTFTRAAYLALTVQAILAGILLLRKRRWLLSSVIFFVIFLTGFAYIENKLIRNQDNLNKMPSLEEYSKMSPEEIEKGYSADMGAGHRLAMWKTAADEILKNPFYPHGYSRFLFGKAVRTAQNKHFIYPQVHNTFIGVTFELGIQGLVVFLWMIGAFAWACWRYWVTAKEDMPQYFSASLITMMAGYWVNNFFGSFDGDDSKLLFMMLLGIGMAVMHKLPKEKSIDKKA
ncbi:MAG: O-antigen ligase family protein [Nitrospirae bacterium]|nr:O-antigen ligase family protein [Nitrospirota bacterium]